MTISQKCQYAVRAILELAKQRGNGPVAIGAIAATQVIPPRFLEIILSELKQGGFVESRRGVQGGYMLATNPDDLTVGQIIRFVDGPFDPVKCVGRDGELPCVLREKCALVALWSRAKEAVESVYDGATFQNLVEQEAAIARSMAADFCI